MGNINFQLTGDAEQALRAFQKLEQGEQKALMKMMGLGQQAKKSKRGMISMAEGTAKSFVSLSAAIGLATKALSAMNEERKKAASSIKSSEMSVRQLAQLSGGSKMEMQRMVNAVKASMREEGMTQQEAAGLQFSLESMGLAGKRKLFAGMHGIADSRALAEGVATLQDAMTREETGGARNVLNKLLAASAVSKTTIGEFAPAATTAAKTVRMAGGSDEELLAVLAQLSKSTKSAEVAGTQIDAFSRALIKHGIKGKGLLGAAREIAGKGLDDDKLLKWFGRIEGFKGFKNIMDQFGAIEATRRQITAAGQGTGAGDLVSRIQSAANDPLTLREARSLRIAKAQNELEGKGIGIVELRRQRVIERSEAASKAAGESAIWRTTRTAGLKLRSWLGQSPDKLERFAKDNEIFGLGSYKEYYDRTGTMKMQVTFEPVQGQDPNTHIE